MGSYLKSLDDFLLQGRTTGKQWAEGRIDNSTSAGITVNNLLFQPSIILISNRRYDGGGTSGSFRRMCVWARFELSAKTIYAGTYYSSGSISGGDVYLLTTGLVITSNGFYVPESDNAFFNDPQNYQNELRWIAIQ